MTHCDCPTSLPPPLTTWFCEQETLVVRQTGRGQMVQLQFNLYPEETLQDLRLEDIGEKKDM